MKENDGHRKGKGGENVVAKAADYLLETWEELVGHITLKMLDSAGIDRLFILKSGLAFCLQVKTSPAGVRSHLDPKKHPEWYQHISVIMISKEEIDRLYSEANIRGVAARIKAMILEAYAKIKSSPLLI